MRKIHESCSIISGLHSNGERRVHVVRSTTPLCLHMHSVQVSRQVKCILRHREGTQRIAAGYLEKMYALQQCGAFRWKNTGPKCTDAADPSRPCVLCLRCVKQVRVYSCPDFMKMSKSSVTWLMNSTNGCRDKLIYKLVNGRMYMSRLETGVRISSLQFWIFKGISEEVVDWHELFWNKLDYTYCADGPLIMNRVCWLSTGAWWLQEVRETLNGHRKWYEAFRECFIPRHPPERVASADRKSWVHVVVL